MNLVIGVEQYLNHKRQNGYAFERGGSYLVALSRRVGDVQLGQVTTLQVLAYLDEADSSSITWRLKYQVLNRFFHFWSDRDAMPELIMPPSKPKVPQSFVPYVFTRPELRALLRATRQNDNCRSRIDRQTMRTFLLLLYGTGALVGEILSLKCCDIDLGLGLVQIRSRVAFRIRQIPLGKDLLEIMRRYMAWRSRKKYSNPLLFVTKADHAIRGRTANQYFERIRRFAGVARTDGAIFQPRMLDLKYTFAVHRITSWIRNGADLNRMLPALAAYMGQVGLGSTERYLSMTPERYRKELEKLSPTRGRFRWRNDKALMEFLAGL